MTITLAVWWVALTQCTAVSRTRPRSTCWLLYTNCGYSQLTPSTSSQSTSPNFTRLPARHFRLSGLLCCRSDSLYLATGQSPWCGAQQQRFQTITENESILSLPLSTHSAVEMLHDSALLNSSIWSCSQLSLMRMLSIRGRGITHQRYLWRYVW